MNLAPAAGNRLDGSAGAASFAQSEERTQQG